MGRVRIGHLVAIFGIGALAMIGSTAFAQVAPDDTTPPSDPADLELSDLSGVVVSGGTYREAVAELAEAEEVLVAAEQALAEGRLSIPDLELAVDRITSAGPRLRSQLALAEEIHATAANDVEALARTRYLRDATRPQGLDLFADPSIYREHHRIDVLLDAATQHRLRTLNAAATLRDERERQVAAAEAGVGRVRTLLDVRRQEFGLAMADAERVDAQLDELQAAVSVERRLGVVDGTDLTFVALEAYVAAAALLGAEDPACGVQWEVLAAIGYIESRHGTYGDSSLDVAGQTVADIIGIPLNGLRNTRVIRDTDGGRLDGDPIYDRAVGPMQFIPTTWAAYGRDGDGDGAADPHNLYDASASAAGYLCAAGHFSSDEGARRAVLAYNHSGTYVDAVLALAGEYAAQGVVVR